MVINFFTLQVGKKYYQKWRKNIDNNNDRLKSSLNQLIIAKNQEINAKFMALQSQMNPHFIFNSLANISAMAEEGMNKDVNVNTKMIKKLKIKMYKKRNQV